MLYMLEKINILTLTGHYTMQTPIKTSRITSKLCLLCLLILKIKNVRLLNKYIFFALPMKSGSIS